MPADDGGGSGACRQIELEENVGDVTLDGMFAERQPLRDRRIAEAVRKECHDLALARAECVEGGGRCGARRGCAAVGNGKLGPIAVTMPPSALATMLDYRGRHAGSVPSSSRPNGW